jgi:hypothetical protein
MAGAFYEGPAEAHPDGLKGFVLGLGDRVAFLTATFGWGPFDGFKLTPRQVKWWYDQAARMKAD